MKAFDVILNGEWSVSGIVGDDMIRAHDENEAWQIAYDMLHEAGYTAEEIKELNLKLVTFED